MMHDGYNPLPRACQSLLYRVYGEEDEQYFNVFDT